VTRVLSAAGLRVGYGPIEVIRGINLHVDAGEVVVILGANGAGKTTTLAALSGVIPIQGGEVEVLGYSDHSTLDVRARRGLSYLPDQRGIVRALTVTENLRLARVDPADAYRISPVLESLANRLGGDLSGGEQQILALTRAIAGKPKLLVADELSFGLAPIVVSSMLQLARSVAESGAGVLLVEQYASRALKLADRAYVMRRGEIVVEGDAKELMKDMDALERSYLGSDSAADAPDPGPAQVKNAAVRND
jgi:branched-chain amino acid transport system ATP-binding protein